MKRIAKFEKVSLTQFKAGCTREDAEKVYEGIKLPKRATAGSAGYDFYAPFDIELNPGETANIPTGIRVLIEDGWVSEFPNDSSPYTSTIVFLVRKGNPKDIHDWDDLIKEDVGIITPNPKTSGGARWNYLAAWGYADRAYGGDEAKTKEFIKKLYENVLVLDSGARGATTTFVENGQGDVLLAWENEAYLSVKDYPDDYEIITPGVSILAQPSVTVVDKVVDKRGTRDAAEEYLNFLYSDEAQRIAGDNYYRPYNETILNEYADVFDLNVDLVTIADFGGWDEAQSKHFADGGVFDEIYEGK